MALNIQFLRSKVIVLTGQNLFFFHDHIPFNVLEDFKLLVTDAQVGVRMSCAQNQLLMSKVASTDSHYGPELACFTFNFVTLTVLAQLIIVIIITHIIIVVIIIITVIIVISSVKLLLHLLFFCFMSACSFSDIVFIASGRQKKTSKNISISRPFISSEECFAWNRQQLPWKQNKWIMQWYDGISNTRFFFCSYNLKLVLVLNFYGFLLDTRLFFSPAVWQKDLYCKKLKLKCHFIWKQNCITVNSWKSRQSWVEAYCLEFWGVWILGLAKVYLYISNLHYWHLYRTLYNLFHKQLSYSQITF